MNQDINQEINQELEKIKNLEGKARYQYIWDYYKLHIIAILIASFLLGSFINHRFINPPPVSILTVAWMASFEFNETLQSISVGLSEPLVEYPGRQLVDVQSYFLTGLDPQFDMAMQQRFMAMVMVREIDLVIGAIDENLMGMEPAGNLRDIRPYLREAGINLEEHQLLYAEDPDGITVFYGINLEGSPFFKQLEIQMEGRFLGIMITSAREDNIINALRVIWDLP